MTIPIRQSPPGAERLLHESARLSRVLHIPRFRAETKSGSRLGAILHSIRSRQALPVGATPWSLGCLVTEIRLGQACRSP
jgi:hypothetical protein